MHKPQEAECRRSDEISNADLCAGAARPRRRLHARVYLGRHGFCRLIAVLRFFRDVHGVDRGAPAKETSSMGYPTQPGTHQGGAASACGDACGGGVGATTAWHTPRMDGGRAVEEPLRSSAFEILIK